VEPKQRLVSRPRDNWWMSGYVDIHAHVLPGIDDGPDNLEQALAMARAAANSGITTIASTPHLRSDFPNVHVHELADRCEALRRALESEAIPIRVVSAAEVSLIWAAEASDEELALASYDQKGRDLLIETPLMSVVGINRFLYELSAKGYRLTLAHPERSQSFQRDESLLEQLVDQRILLEVNAGSLVGSTGSRGTERFARRLVSQGLANVIASDGHRASAWRPVTRLREGVDAAAELVGRGRAQWMATAVPDAIIEGRELPPAPPVVERHARRKLFPSRYR
jgi:protein-tyrosine phosphatase